MQVKRKASRGVLGLSTVVDFMHHIKLPRSKIMTNHEFTAPDCGAYRQLDFSKGN